MTDFVIPVPTLRTFVASRKIPFYKLGHRTLLFDPKKVDRALECYEIREVGARPRKGEAK